MILEDYKKITDQNFCGKHQFQLIQFYNHNPKYEYERVDDSIQTVNSSDRKRSPVEQVGGLGRKELNDESVMSLPSLHHMIPENSESSYRRTRPSTTQGITPVIPSINCHPLIFPIGSTSKIKACPLIIAYPLAV